MSAASKPTRPNALSRRQELERSIAELRAEIRTRDAFLARVSRGLDHCVEALPKSVPAAELAGFAREFALVAREERPVPRTRTVDLTRVIPELVARWWPRLQAQLGELPRPKLEVEKGVRARVDPEHLETVFVELVSNACKYGGTSPIVVGAGVNGRSCCLSVVDRGPARWRVSAGRRFVRGNAALRSPGFGLGVWLSRRLAVANGGRLNIRRLVAGGTRASLTLVRA